MFFADEGKEELQLREVIVGVRYPNADLHLIDDAIRSYPQTPDVVKAKILFDPVRVGEDHEVFTATIH